MLFFLLYCNLWGSNSDEKKYWSICTDTQWACCVWVIKDMNPWNPCLYRCTLRYFMGLNALQHRLIVVFFFAVLQSLRQYQWRKKVLVNLHWNTISMLLLCCIGHKPMNFLSLQVYCKIFHGFDHTTTQAYCFFLLCCNHWGSISDEKKYRSICHDTQ